MSGDGWNVFQEYQHKNQSFVSFRKGKMINNMTVAKDPRTGKQIVAVMYYEEQPLPCGSVVAVSILMISPMTAATDWAASSRGDMRTKVVAWAGWDALTSTLQQLNAATQVLTLMRQPAVADVGAQTKNGCWPELAAR